MTISTLTKNLTPRTVLTNIAGSAILAFGLYHIHSFSQITEGGILGLTLLLHHWFDLSPAVSGFVMNFTCYLIGLRILGSAFILSSVIAGGSFSFFYAIFEQFPPLWPQLVDFPLLAALLGAVFVGVGVGLCVRVGGAPGGDDALTLALQKLTGAPIERIYLIGDVTVLLLSLSYLPITRILFSLVTVTLSSNIIGIVERFGAKKPFPD